MIYWRRCSRTGTSHLISTLTKLSSDRSSASCSWSCATRMSKTRWVCNQHSTGPHWARRQDCCVSLRVPSFQYCKPTWNLGPERLSSLAKDMWLVMGGAWIWTGTLAILVYTLIPTLNSTTVLSSTERQMVKKLETSYLSYDDLGLQILCPCNLLKMLNKG